MIEKRVEVNGEELVLDSSGALWWPRERVLVFADMHFEKGSFYAYTGQFLPPYDTRSTLKRVVAAVDTYKPSIAIALLPLNAAVVAAPGVLMLPGAIAFTAIPRDPSSSASDRVSITIPPFEAS